MTVISEFPVDLQLDGRYPLHDVSDDLSPYEIAISPDQIIRFPPEIILQLVQNLPSAPQAGSVSCPDLDVNPPPPSVQPVDIQKELNIMRGDEAFQTSEERGFPCLEAIETIDIGIPQS